MHFLELVPFVPVTWGNDSSRLGSSLNFTIVAAPNIEQTAGNISTERSKSYQDYEGIKRYVLATRGSKGKKVMNN